MKAHFDNRLPMDVLHHHTTRLFREYMLVDGMPQAVIAYGKNKDFEAAENEKRKILKIYHDDIYKADNPEKIISIYDNIPSELKTKEKRFIFTNAITDARYEDLEASFTWLKEAMIVNNCNMLLNLQECFHKVKKKLLLNAIIQIPVYYVEFYINIKKLLKEFL